jgi:hypothetical protein
MSGTQTAAPATQAAQPKSPKYLEIDYMKVEPGKDNDYLRVEQGLWKPLHQQRVKNGDIRSWTLYGLRFPSGTSEKYDYVTVNAFERFAQLENPYADAAQILDRVHPGIKVADFVQQTESTRKLVRSEVWELIDEAR